jgi:hypothetical protein
MSEIARHATRIAFTSACAVASVVCHTTLCSAASTRPSAATMHAPNGDPPESIPARARSIAIAMNLSSAAVIILPNVTSITTAPSASKHRS